MGRNLTTDGFNLKLLKEGSGSGTVPARTGVDFQYDRITIAHGYGSSELLWQVAISPTSSDAQYFTPFAANGSFAAIAYLDSTNLYIEVMDGSVVNESAINFDYTYRILIP